MTSKDLLIELDDLRREMRAIGIEVKACNNQAGGLTLCRSVKLDRRLAQRIAQAISAAMGVLETPDNLSVPNGSVDGLSQRQKEILSWVALGKSNSVIATILGISPHTVDTHLRRIFERLGTTDRTVAAIRGVEAGLISPGERRAA